MNLNCRYPKSNANIRLICFPWAGGGAAFYAAWGKDVSEDIEVTGYCLPGREKRFKDPCNYTFDDILTEIVKTIHEDFSDKPFAFWGHSLGAMLSFKAACKLKELYGKEPQHIFLSGSTALHSPNRYVANFKNLSQEEFLAKMEEIGGTPQELLDSPDLFAVFAPAILADFAMLQDIIYKYDPDVPPPLTCPIDFFDGTEDKDHDIPAWKQVTSGSFTFHPLPGHHFYLKTPANTKKIIDVINARFGGFEDIV